MFKNILHILCVYCIGVKGGVPMNGILFAPVPGSARGWAGRVPGPSRRPGPPGAGPARKASHSVCLSVCPASLQKRSRSSVGPQKELCFITFSGIWHKWKFRCVCDCIAPGIFTSDLHFGEKWVPITYATRSASAELSLLTSQVLGPEKSNF